MTRTMDLIRDLRDGHARLEQLLNRFDGVDVADIPRDELNELQGPLQRALDAIRQVISGPPARIEPEPTPQADPGPSLQMMEWLGRQIQEARRSSPFVAPLIREVRQATDALQGLEGKALEQARQVQDMSLRSLIRHVLENRRR
jgi:hypothetical protein